MRKIIMIILAGALVISGLGTLATNIDKNNFVQPETVTEMLEIDTPSIRIVEVERNYIEVQFVDEENYLMNPGQPMIPRVINTYELPFGATNIKIDAVPIDIKEIELTKEIVPSSAPLPQAERENMVLSAQKDLSIYGSNELYPHEWISHHVGVGLNKDAEIVTHLTINTFPIRYNPAEGKFPAKC
jgi:hypothetical protein